HKWFWVFKQVKSFDPDIIHINTEFVIAEFGFWFARAHNLPAIYTFHTMWEDYGPNYFSMFPTFFVKLIIRGILKNILSRSYRVIVPTTQIDEVVHKYRPTANTFLLPTGIDAKLFKYRKDEINAFRKKLEERYPLLPGKKILLFAGRVVKEKNLGFLINLLPDILAEYPEAVLLIAGDGPDQEFYKSKVKKAKLEGACLFTGYMERKELALTYALSDVFVFPSLTDTQGLVTLEAMLSGTPVVAIGALGTLMVMGGDKGGFMVNNDQKEFVKRVLELLRDPALHRRKSLEAKAHAKSWCIDEMTKKLIGIYESTIASYIEDYGDRRTPVWGLLMDKRWWKANNRYFQIKTKQKLQRMRSRLTR
ncbi:MAG: glycosyltransferase, partial [Treponema sp.]|nr:glycosyltransferase [Treponema sp.]